MKRMVLLVSIITGVMPFLMQAYSWENNKYTSVALGCNYDDAETPAYCLTSNASWALGTSPSTSPSKWYGQRYIGTGPYVYPESDYAGTDNEYFGFPYGLGNPYWLSAPFYTDYYPYEGWGLGAFI